MPRVRIGISGWTYAGWRGVFYPPKLARRRELEFATRAFDVIEINGTFYSLQRPDAYGTWRDASPPGFEFAIKGGRFITHMLKLKDAGQALANFFASGVLRLGDRLGPFLWQLPERLAFDPGRLEEFLAQLPRTTREAARLAERHDHRVAGRAHVLAGRNRRLRHALEPRSPSFRTPEAAALLRRHGVALVVADSAGRWPQFDEVTADFAYVRLHGSTELYASAYTDDELDAWADRVARWTAAGLDAYVFFDNDAKVHAPFDAQRLGERLRDRTAAAASRPVGAATRSVRAARPGRRAARRAR